MYRILTEDVNEPLLIRIVKEYFSGFTLLHALGYWQGKPEQSAVFEIATDDKQAIERAANNIRVANAQTSVLVQDIPSTDTFVTSTIPQSKPLRSWVEPI
jgi:hypothetical protein